MHAWPGPDGQSDVYNIDMIPIIDMVTIAYLWVLLLRLNGLAIFLYTHL